MKGNITSENTPVKKGNKTKSKCEQKSIISNLISEKSTELKMVGDNEKVTPSDIAQIKERFFAYLELVQASGTVPTIEGIARAYGITRRIFCHWLESAENQVIRDFFEMVIDLCCEILQLAMLNNNYNNTASTSMLKNYQQLYEKLDKKKDALGESVNPEKIAEKYRASMPEIED